MSSLLCFGFLQKLGQLSLSRYKLIPLLNCFVCTKWQILSQVWCIIKSLSQLRKWKIKFFTFLSYLLGSTNERISFFLINRTHWHKTNFLRIHIKNFYGIRYILIGRNRFDVILWHYFLYCRCTWSVYVIYIFSG